MCKSTDIPNSSNTSSGKAASARSASSTTVNMSEGGLSSSLRSTGSSSSSLVSTIKKRAKVDVSVHFTDKNSIDCRNGMNTVQIEYIYSNYTFLTPEESDVYWWSAKELQHIASQQLQQFHQSSKHHLKSNNDDDNGDDNNDDNANNNNEQGQQQQQHSFLAENYFGLYKDCSDGSLKSISQVFRSKKTKTLLTELDFPLGAIAWEDNNDVNEIVMEDEEPHYSLRGLEPWLSPKSLTSLRSQHVERILNLQKEQQQQQQQGDNTPFQDNLRLSSLQISQASVMMARVLAHYDTLQAKEDY